MKTITQFLEDNKFLIKGHTKRQNGPFEYLSISEIRQIPQKIKKNKIIFQIIQNNSIAPKRFNERTDEQLQAMYNYLFDVLNQVDYKKIKYIDIYFVGGLGGFSFCGENIKKPLMYLYNSSNNDVNDFKTILPSPYTEYKGDKQEIIDKAKEIISNYKEK